ncbi:programmed cell death protein 5-like [Tubulanus polymorphus]|uniref:programmed cell death protein 5-like n=1 Tax=Tubulanus polymorphus TaxID=672921 RepID=UPI003DA57A63
MADADLEAIRAKRMAELESQYSGRGGGGGGPSPEQQQAAMNKEREMKNSILSQVLDQKARARLNSIALVKPEKAAMVENAIISMARTGQIGGKLDEPSLIGILEQFNEKTNKTTTVKFERRRVFDEDDD